MNDPQQRSLTLHLGMSLIRRAHLARLLGLAFGLPLIALAVVAYWVLAHGAWDREGSDLLGLLWKTVTQDPDLKPMLWALALLGPVGIVSIASQRHAYLQITSQGLEGYVPRWTGLGFSRQTTGRWRVSCAAIRAVRLVHGQHARQPAQRLGGYRLVLDTDRGETWLSPFSWVDRQGRDHRLGLNESNEYWAQYPMGAEHPFTLLRGAGMFYQLDLAPFYTRTQAFYAAQEEGG